MRCAITGRAPSFDVASNLFNIIPSEWRQNLPFMADGKCTHRLPVRTAVTLSASELDGSE